MSKQSTTIYLILVGAITIGSVNGDLTGVRPGPITERVWVPRLPSNYNISSGATYCEFENKNETYPYQEVFACSLLPGNLLGTYPPNVPLTTPPYDGNYFLRSVFTTQSIAAMIQDGCFSVEMRLSPEYKSSMYQYESFSSYKRTLREEFNLDVSGGGTYDAGWASVSAQASYSRSTTSDLSESGVRQASGGNKHEKNTVAKLYNRCMKSTCENGKRCLKAYLPEQAVQLWEEIKAQPHALEPMRNFVTEYGSIFATSWVFGATKALDFTVNFQSSSTASSSSVSNGLSVAVEASGGQYDVNAATNMKSAYGKTDAATSGKSSLKVTTHKSGPCTELESQDCTSLMIQDLSTWGPPMQVTSFQGVASALSRNGTIIEITSRTLYQASARCLSLQEYSQTPLPVSLTWLTVYYHDSSSGIHYYMNCADNNVGDKRACAWEKTLQTVWLNKDPSFINKGRFEAYNAHTFYRYSGANIWLNPAADRNGANLGDSQRLWEYGDGTLCTLPLTSQQCVTSSTADALYVQALEGVILQPGTREIIATC
eukprot:CAMPEP_0203744386 /NCGR_PEP_ID=MMETSP0098-20131031/475_1 /ASSEMBLY_ACC=CAM_ASM_000208 /TAXON_ID=96639 /ORGANISM=" , Strain NY0313808BC1" /LENGTH=541 /DNA_ID=CAMNT_0050631891 /DNA_START=91 /DNA_END=1716 /DNA_ORIENTATION=+